MLKQIIKKVLKKKSKNLYPESLWNVKTTNDGIISTNYSGVIKEILFSDLDKICIETNDSGPFLTDFYWIFITNTEQLSIPQGATGEAEMIARIKLFNGFNHDNFGDAIRSNKNANYVIWSK